MHTAAPRERLVAAFVAAGYRHESTFEHSVNFAHPNGAPVQLASDPIFDQPIDRAELLALKERSAVHPRRRKSSALQDRTDIERLRGDVGDPNEGW